MPFLPTEAFPVDFLPSGNVRPLADVVWTGSRGDAVTIAAGYVSDLGTVPRLLRGLLPHDGPAARAFLVHDVLCTAQHQYRAALDAYAHRVRTLPGSQWGPRPVAPAFDAVDTDAVLRVILAELGVGPVRWLYWEGVRAGALGSRGRRAGWWRTLPAFVALAPVTLAVVAPAALGTALSRALLACWWAACWPFERATWRRRAAREARALYLADEAAQPCPIDGDACTVGCEDRPACAGQRRALTGTAVDVEALARVFAVPLSVVRPVVLPAAGTRVELGDGEAEALTGTALDASARDYFGSDYPPEHGDHPNAGALVAFRAGWRRGVDRVREVEAAAARESSESAARTGQAPAAGPCPAGTHSNTGTAADEEIAACPRCSPRSGREPEVRESGEAAARPSWVRRAGAAVWRGLCAVGRGIADFLAAVLDAAL